MDITVKVLAIGTFLAFPGKCPGGAETGQAYEIIRHRIEIDETDTLVMTDLLAVGDEAEDLGKPIISVNLDMWDFAVED